MERAGFAIRDVLVGVIVLGTLGALAVPTLSQVRMDSGRQACNGNYRFIAQASGSYTYDYSGYMWALNWKKGMYSPVNPNQSYSTDIQAQADQAATILRRLANLSPTSYPTPFGWISPISYSLTALMDYVNMPIPASYLVCPEDWVRQPFLEGDFSILSSSGGDGSSSSWRARYSSSYTLGTSHWGVSRQTMVPQYSGFPGGPFVRSPVLYQTSSNDSNWSYDGYLDAPNVHGPKQESEVRFPSNKVFLFDEYARHNGKPRYFAYQSAGQDLLFYDGSLRYYRTDSTNPGWDASHSTIRGNMTSRFQFWKYANIWGGLDNGVSQANFRAGWYRWTRGGLYGWDVPRLSSMVGKLPNSSIIENEVDTSPATGAW